MSEETEKAMRGEHVFDAMGKPIPEHAHRFVEQLRAEAALAGRTIPLGGPLADILIARQALAQKQKE